MRAPICSRYIAPIVFVIFIWVIFCFTASVFAQCRNDINSRYLAIDQSLHKELKNIEMVMGQARHKKRLWTSRQEPWEDKNHLDIGYIGTVIRDHEGRYRMYYELLRSNERRATAVAFSEDGINWVKPKLNIAKNLIDDPASNLIYTEPHEGMREGEWYRSAAAFYDSHASSPDGRYKLMWREGHDIFVASSRDGLHFKTHGLAVKHYADTMASMFFDPMHNDYVIYGRHWFDRAGRPTKQQRLGADGKPPVRRGVVIHRSKIWEKTPWPKDSVGDVIIDPIDFFQGGGWFDLYTPSVQFYHGQYVGLPSVYFRRPFDDLSNTSGPIYAVFMYSQDGRQWRFPEKQHPIIDLTQHLSAKGLSEQSKFGTMLTCSNFLELNDELLIYYLYFDGQHHKNRNRASFELATMRKDGFASLRSHGSEPGIWLTSNVKIPPTADTLHINARVPGELKVEVLDCTSNKPISGLSKDNCQAFSGDHTNAEIKWVSETLSRAQGQNVRLRFFVTKGEIFSFWFG